MWSGLWARSGHDGTVHMISFHNWPNCVYVVQIGQYHNWPSCCLVYVGAGLCMEHIWATNRPLPFAVSGPSITAHVRICGPELGQFCYVGFIVLSTNLKHHLTICEHLNIKKSCYVCKQQKHKATMKKKNFYKYNWTYQILRTVKYFQRPMKLCDMLLFQNSAD